jgi:DeoD family purine-nucleoside phosphorylase
MSDSAPLSAQPGSVEPVSVSAEPVRGSPAPGGSIHLRPTAELAERVLLPGDPGRALALAQMLISEPRMFNHHRGLWGYTGPARADGEPLTIQATGMGGPSAAIVLHELICLGARRAIRVGTCGALSLELALGDLVIARDSICADGTSQALGGGERVAADTPLTEALLRAGAARAQTGSSPRRMHAGTVESVDLFYEPTPGAGRAQDAADALAVEMEAATLFAVGAAASVPVACVLAVSDTFDADGVRARIDDRSLLAAAEAMGAVAVAALSA